MTNNDLEPAERYTRQPALSFQKCYERDQNMKARNHRPKARSHTIALLSTGWGSDKSNSLEKLLHITLYFRKKKKKKLGRAITKISKRLLFASNVCKISNKY